MKWQTILAVGSGGFIGAVSRMYVINIINSWHHYQIPIATIIVNILGSIILGGLVAYFTHYNANIILKSFLVTGLLGAFTTFSTFAIESIFLFHSAKLLFVYVSLSTIGSIIFAFIAYKSVISILN